MDTIKKNDEFEILIDRFGDNAEGIGDISGKVVFVMHALPGENVKVHVINDKKSYVLSKGKQIE